MLMLSVRDELEKIDSAISKLSALRHEVIVEDQPALKNFRSMGDLARHYLHLRRLRESRLPDMFQDPAWDILLDLFAAASESKKISVSSACIASAVPPTTALRHIQKLKHAGLLCRYAAPDDRRRVYVAITARGEEVVRDFLSGITAPKGPLSALS